MPKAQQNPNYLNPKQPSIVGICDLKFDWSLGFEPWGFVKNYSHA